MGKPRRYLYYFKAIKALHRDLKLKSEEIQEEVL